MSLKDAKNCKFILFSAEGSKTVYGMDGAIQTAMTLLGIHGKTNLTLGQISDVYDYVNSNLYINPDEFVKAMHSYCTEEELKAFVVMDAFRGEEEKESD